MTIKQHIRMTASEIAMGRYMRAPDHPADDDEFSKAFAAEVLTGATEGGANGSGAGAAEAAAAAADGAAAGGGDAGATGGDGAGAAPEAGSNQGAAADAGAAAAEGGAAAAAGAAADGRGGEGDAAGEGNAGGDGAGGDAGDGAAAADGGGADKTGASAAAVPDSAAAEAILDQLAEALAAKGKPAAGADSAQGQGAEAEAPPLFNEAEQAQLAKFKDEWPEEAKAVELMQRELGRGVIQYVFDQIAPSVKEIRDLVQTLALRAAHGDIVTDLGEYPSDQEIDEIKDWVKTQPSYLQSGMNSVIGGGTPDEVIDLVSRYREATGKKPAGAQVPDPKSQGGETELSGPVKQAAVSLAPVGSKRSAVQSPEDASDFDAAWAKFAEQTV